MAHKFLVKKRLSLSFLGDGWQDCYIDVTPFSPSQLQKILESPVDAEKTPEVASKNLNQTIGRLRDAFVSGKALTEDGVIDLVADDIVDMPLEVTTRLASLVMGDVDPNLQAPSTP